MQFDIVICGLDSVEARRWINATLVGMVDYDNIKSLKPLVDGGTEGEAGLTAPRITTLTCISRLQRTSSCHLSYHDFMYRVSTGHACTTSTSSSLHNCHDPTSTTALHRMGTSDSMVL